jgi:poly(3-hydroxybutyrate) depolymerase
MGRVKTWVALNGERVFVWTFVVVFLAVVAFLLYFGTPFHGSETSIQSVYEDDRIDVDRTGRGGYVMRPAGTDPQRGLVFYPGARVDPDAYLASLAPLVHDTNTTVVVAKMPLNLAVLDQGAADRVIDRYDGPRQWYVGGHSLGGAMACRYARDNPQRVSGLVLFGAYCDKSIAQTDLRVLSVRGEADTVLDRDTYERNKRNLPSATTHSVLVGVNHTQFGSYTGQWGDRPSGTSYGVAHRRLAETIVPWFENASG